jgi:hypothetical protein
MANRTYLLPQVIVQQDFVALPASATQDLIAVIVGPLKTIVDTKDINDDHLTNYGSFNSVSDVTYSLKGIKDTDKLIEDSVYVELNDLLASYASMSSTDGVSDISIGSSQNLIQISSSRDGFVAHSEISASRNALLKNRDAKVGDGVIVYKNGVEVLTTRIFDFIRDRVPATLGTISSDISNLDGAASFAFNAGLSSTNSLDRETGPIAGDEYVGDLENGIGSDTYTISCVTGGNASAARFNITSVNGDNKSNVSIVSGELSVGSRGLKVEFIGSDAAAAFTTAEKYVVDVSIAHSRAQVPEISSTTPVGASYSGAFNTVYEVKVISGGLFSNGVQVVVTTNNNVDSFGPQTITSSSKNFYLGSLGLTASFGSSYTNSGLAKGDTFYIPVNAATLGESRQIKLLDSIPASVTGPISIDLCYRTESLVVPRSGYPRPGDTAWELSSDLTELTIQSNILVSNSEFTELSNALSMLPVKKAKIKIGFEAIQVEKSNRIITISEASLLPVQLGKLDPRNQLCYGVWKALQNSGGTRIYAVGVDEDSVDGYNRAFDSTLSEVTAYYICPMTNDEQVIQAAKSHVLSASDELIARERIAIVNQAFSTISSLYDKTATGESWTGFVSILPGSSPAVYNQVTIPGATLLTSKVRAGDFFRSNFSIDSLGNETFQTFKIVDVRDEENLVLSSPAFSSSIGDINSLRRVQIVRNLTRREQAQAIAASSSRLGNRRVVNTWPDVLRDGADTVAGYYGSAAIAGLKSGVAPHQPVTNVILNGFTKADRSTPYFTLADLNIAAQGGTWIIDQEGDQNGVSGAIYNRHQLTTDYTDDNMAEVSITTNLDSISKIIREDLKQFIGQWNNHPFFQQLLKTRLVDRLTYLQGYAVTVKAGPQLLDFKITKLATDPLIRTRVNVEIDLTLPYPVNVIQVKLTVV